MSLRDSEVCKILDETEKPAVRGPPRPLPVPAVEPVFTDDTLPEATVILLAASFCPACAELKEELKDYIRSGEIQVIDVESDLGADIYNEIEANGAPAMALKNETGYILLDIEEFTELIRTAGDVPAGTTE